MLRKFAVALAAFGPLGVLLLSTIDSFGVPLPATMDALLILIAVRTPERAYFSALMAVVGSLGGNIALFLTARAGLSRFVRSGPDTPGRRYRFQQWFHRYGLLTVFVPAVTPVVPLPLKFFVVSAGSLRTPLGRFLGVIVAARAIRFFGEAWLGIRLGADAQSFLTRNSWSMVGAALVLALVPYFIIRFAEWDRPRENASRATVDADER